MNVIDKIMNYFKESHNKGDNKVKIEFNEDELREILQIHSKRRQAERAKESLVKEILEMIDSPNRGNSDYFIVDKIEELCKNVLKSEKSQKDEKQEIVNFLCDLLDEAIVKTTFETIDKESLQENWTLLLPTGDVYPASYNASYFQRRTNNLPKPP